MDELGLHLGRDRRLDAAIAAAVAAALICSTVWISVSGAATSPPRSVGQHGAPALRPRSGVDAEHEGRLLQLDVAEHHAPSSRVTFQKSAFSPSAARAAWPGRLPEPVPERRGLLRGGLRAVRAALRRFRRGLGGEGESHGVEDDLVALAVDRPAAGVRSSARGSTSSSQAVVNSGAARRGGPRRDRPAASRAPSVLPARRPPRGGRRPARAGRRTAAPCPPG